MHELTRCFQTNTTKCPSTHLAYRDITIEHNVPKMSLADGLVQDVWRQVSGPQIIVLIFTGAVDEPVDG